VSDHYFLSSSIDGRSQNVHAPYTSIIGKYEVAREQSSRFREQSLSTATSIQQRGPDRSLGDQLNQVWTAYLVYQKAYV